VRVDCEDRDFHQETTRSPEAETHFREACTPHPDGFELAPEEDRRLRVHLSGARFHPEEEWCERIPHPFEATRGQRDHGDAWSPGWFQADLDVDDEAVLTCALDEDGELPPPPEPTATDDDDFAARLRRACAAFLVRRGAGRTVIAGYPWFLDWGRDTLICARGLLAAGWHDEVRDILRVFGRFEDRGTLPNCLMGDDASNRETSDAPLWFAVVCDEYARATGDDLAAIEVDGGGRDLLAVCRSIRDGHRAGTPVGVRVDPASDLVWSPSHFTWMDTDHPAGTPREGFPIEIQALWWRLLRCCGDRDAAERVRATIAERYATGDGWLADGLLADAGTAAADAVPDRSLRSNALLAIALGAVDGAPARATCRAAERHLVVPGALRSLAPLPVDPPLEIRDHRGRLLGDPEHPYRGRYEGDEDTRRKPAYHNGTAWTWPFPNFCEALVRAWPDDPRARHAARAWLRSMEPLLDAGCAGHLPEICDGDAPHAQRGCDAQAWGATEALRVWLQLKAEG